MEKEKVKITKHTWTTEEIEVYFPRYYKHVLYCDEDVVTVYGRIERDTVVSIHEDNSDEHSITYKVKKEEFDADRYGSYFSEDNDSTMVEFLQAKERLNKFTQNL